MYDDLFSQQFLYHIYHYCILPQIYLFSPFQFCNFILLSKSKNIIHAKYFFDFLWKLKKRTRDWTRDWHVQLHRQKHKISLSHTHTKWVWYFIDLDTQDNYFIIMITICVVTKGFDINYWCLNKMSNYLHFNYMYQITIKKKWCIERVIMLTSIPNIIQFQ